MKVNNYNKMFNFVSLKKKPKNYAIEARKNNDKLSNPFIRKTIESLIKYK